MRLNTRAVDILEKTLGSEHPNLATTLNLRAILMAKQVIDKHMRYLRGVRPETSHR